MAASVFKHLDDDGNLSLFVSKESIIVTCENGHFWVVEAQQVESQEKLTERLDAKAAIELTRSLS